MGLELILPDRLYAILDIETTGGLYNEESITEIAIYRFDGHRVTDQLISLINPEKEIQPYVVNLTGINRKMLRAAPKFYEVAKRIIEVTEGCVLVAHNSAFDYRVIQLEFKRLGYDFQRRSICTVDLAKELIPDQESYSLGKLARALGIPVADRHRAEGDAKATVQLFKLLLSKDIEKKIVQEHVQLITQPKLTRKLLDILDTLPQTTGVYYMHKKGGEIIYIGKSKNIKKRVNQHFTSDNPRSRKIRREVVAVTFEETGSELIALLKESAEIKANGPRYNYARRRSSFKFHLDHSQDSEGYIRFRITKRIEKRPLTSFTTYAEAEQFLVRISQEYRLCPKLNELDRSKHTCFSYSIGRCNGACSLGESSSEYNARAYQLLERCAYPNADMVIIDRGREVDERSVILIEDGTYKGYGFCNLNYQIERPELLRRVITQMDNDPDVQAIIQSFIRKGKVLKIKKLNTNKI